uniref:Uncharacterized protein n=1 Tax=Parascaris equorum TaxID=6256 RepID=A0A914SBZ8_PAREQ
MQSKETQAPSYEPLVNYSCAVYECGGRANSKTPRAACDTISPGGISYWDVTDRDILLAGFPSDIPTIDFVLLDVFPFNRTVISKTENEREIAKNVNCHLHRPFSANFSPVLSVSRNPVALQILFWNVMRHLRDTCCDYPSLGTYICHCTFCTFCTVILQLTLEPGPKAWLNRPRRLG